MGERFLNDRVELLCGDCREQIATLADNSIDAVVTDPPYSLVSIVRRFGSENAAPALSSAQRRFAKTGAAMSLGPDGQPTPDQYGRLSKGFMGKAWDTGEVAFDPAFWADVLRVLKPGGHVLAMGGTRTYHRLACAIEDAGFEIRDCVLWLYGSGFPKSHDVSKGIDRAAGAEREVVGVSEYAARRVETKQRPNTANVDGYVNPETSAHITAPATDAARQWQGWGTALKPAVEPIVLARKPLSEQTIAANVLKHGTGALNIDACRVDGEGNKTFVRDAGDRSREQYRTGTTIGAAIPTSQSRWPANLILSENEDEYELKAFTSPERKRELFRWLSENT